MREWSTLRKLMLLKGATGAPLNEYTATGNPLTFNTNKAKPLRSVLATWQPHQGGTGDPSPENVRPILGTDAVTVYHSGEDTSNPTTYPVTFPALGKNLFDKSTVESGKIWWRGKTSTNASFSASALIPVVPGETYTINRNATGQNTICYFDADRVYLDQNVQNPTTWEIPANVYFIAFNVLSDSLDTAMFNEGSTALPYEPYTNTVYGGSLDLTTGVLTAEWGILTAKWSDFVTAESNEEFERKTIPYGGIFVKEASGGKAMCNVAKKSWSNLLDSAHFYISASVVQMVLPVGTSESTDITVIAELAEPQTFQLTPQQITALIGNNTMWADADELSVTYLKKG